jgi:hypothetical protein
MNKIREYLDLRRPSIFLIALPYFTINLQNIIYSTFFSFTQLIFIFALILFIEGFFNWILFKLNEKANRIISLFVVFASIYFFYGLYINSLIQEGFKEYFNIVIRGRTIIELLIILFTLFILTVKKKVINYNYLNIFLIAFVVSTTLYSITDISLKREKKFKSSFVSVTLDKTPIKPILLIISDEYTSPDGLYRIYKDSSIYEFSNNLLNKGWITKNSFYTYETSTIHCLSSLFNFNLSKNKKYRNEEIKNIGAAKFMYASIADSLEKKKIRIVNFGIFHVGKHIYLNRLYFYPSSFVEDIMMHTVYYTIKYNTGNLNENGLTSSYYPMETHNKYIFNNLTDSLNSLNNNKTFAYVHLYMPHSPMQYMPNFPLRTENNIVNYKAYWDLTNIKLNILLSDLIKSNKYRIILTGDHGYRSEDRINPHYTFSAFYGFTQNSIDKINSVQDLGSLINSGF